MGLEFGPSSLTEQDRIEFFRTLGGWLNSGGGRMSVAESVSNTCDAFSHDEYYTLRHKMEIIINEVKGGQTRLFEALRQSRLGFTPQEISIIAAAEKSNQLRDAVPALVGALDMQLKGRKSLSGQLTMPLVVGFMLILMSLGVLLFMLPMVMGPVIERKPESLEKFPAILQWYWAASVWLRSNWLVPAMAPILPVSIFLLRNTKIIKPYMARFLMWFTPSKRMIISFNAVLISFFMPALLRSGMPTHEVLETLADCIKTPKLVGYLRIAAQDHANGMRMAKALQIMPFKASFVNAIKAGEETGAIAERVSELQEPYSMELKRQIKQTVGSLKFMVMTILLPFFIISTYTALVGPIFALMEY